MGCHIKAKTDCKYTMNPRIDFKSTENNKYVKIEAFMS